MSERSRRPLEGRVAIVTGASRGIGAGIAKRFAAEGAAVALVARTVEPDARIAGSLTGVAAAIREAGGTCLVVQADLAVDAELERIVSATTAALGAPSILVNNAAWSRFPALRDVPLRHVQLALQMNLLAPHRLSQLVCPAMVARGEGWILNISSATADLPDSAPWDTASRQFGFHHHGHPAVYGTSKAALERLTAGWAIELAGTGIAVNALAPVGAVASEGALAVGGWDERDPIEPLGAMVEAALQLCHRPATELSGRIARSQPLLAELGVDWARPDDGGISAAQS